MAIPMPFPHLCRCQHLPCPISTAWHALFRHSPLSRRHVDFILNGHYGDSLFFFKTVAVVPQCMISTGFAVICHEITHFTTAQSFLDSVAMHIGAFFMLIRS
jgi:hypothetical protein